MARIGLISDIHGNAHALRAVLGELTGCDEVVCGGDIVGYGAHSAECVRLVREVGGHSVLGNHEMFLRLARERPEILQAARTDNPVWAGIRHALATLDDEPLEWLAALPATLPLPGNALVSHASLHDPQGWPYLSDATAARPTLELLDKAGLRAGFFGHTHQQEWFALRGKPAPVAVGHGIYQIPAGGVCAVIVGSVGQPRNGDRRAAWTIWDSDAATFEFRRTEYPAAQAARDILAAGLPASSARRLLGC